MGVGSGQHVYSMFFRRHVLRADSGRSVFIRVHPWLFFVHRPETQPVDQHVSRAGRYEEDGFGYVSWTEHVRPGNESLTMIGIDRVPHRGVGRTGRHEREPYSASPVFRKQRLVQTSQPELAGGIRRILGKADVIGHAADGDERPRPAFRMAGRNALAT